MCVGVCLCVRLGGWLWVGGWVGGCVFLCVCSRREWRSEAIAECGGFRA